MKPDLKKFLEMPVNSGNIVYDPNTGCGCIKGNYNFLTVGRFNAPFLKVSSKVKTILDIAEAILVMHKLPQKAKIYAHTALSKLSESEFTGGDYLLSAMYNGFWNTVEDNIKPFSSGRYVPVVDKVKTRLVTKELVDVCR